MRIPTCIAALVTLLVPAAAIAQTSANIEKAARMNVAENLCDVNYNAKGSGPGGVVYYTMMAAAELRVSLEAAAGLADARHRQIVAYLNKAHKLDEFCRNARVGKL